MGMSAAHCQGISECLESGHHVGSAFMITSPGFTPVPNYTVVFGE